ncbi:MAG: IPExxxVDY family protein [Flavobacteriales bacterium]|nr:IPExxxVDY family protein [Flavobacteriales bacterium]
MAKFTLDIEENYDFALIGISCHSKDYKLAYELNRTLEIDLLRDREEDLEKVTKEGVGIFALYKFFHDEDLLDYFLISNYSDNGLLIPEQKGIDFFMIVKGAINDNLTQDITDKINSSPIVLTAVEIDINGLKSKKNLIL